jgi:hypothetical protein
MTQIIVEKLGNTYLTFFFVFLIYLHDLFQLSLITFFVTICFLKHLINTFILATKLLTYFPHMHPRYWTFMSASTRYVSVNFGSEKVDEINLEMTTKQELAFYIRKYSEVSLLVFLLNQICVLILHLYQFLTLLEV